MGNNQALKDRYKQAFIEIVQEMIDNTEEPNEAIEDNDDDDFFGPRQVPERMTAELIVNNF